MHELPSKRKPDKSNLIPDPEASAHYDLSDKFFSLCLDPSMMYSCGYFGKGAANLESAQYAKIDDAIEKLDLKPSQEIIEIGCGWGSAAKRFREKVDISLTAITLSQNHAAKTREIMGNDEKVDVRVEGWQVHEVDKPYDAVVGFGFFEHVMRPYEPFFQKAKELIKPGGLMYFETITLGKPPRERMSFARHYRLMKELFPGSEIPNFEEPITEAEKCGFKILDVENRADDYAKTLEAWGDNLESNREEATALISEEGYQKFMSYFRNSAAYFKAGELGVGYYLMSNQKI